MAATSTQSPNPLINKLQQDHPDLIFRQGAKFTFRPPKTIILGPPCDNHALLTLHELAHAILKHKDYTLHIERLKIESEAWNEAKNLAAKYNIPWDEDFAQNRLDTYRDWLHQKSLCKNCQLTRYQDQKGTYHCPHCD